MQYGYMNFAINAIWLYEPCEKMQYNLTYSM